MTITGPSTRVDGARSARGKLIGELLLPLILVALGVFTFIGISTMEVIGDSVPGPQFFPAIIAVLLLVTGGCMAVGALRRWFGHPAENDAESDAETADTETEQGADL
ncbi:hypothetical protein F7P69_04960 [Cellulosimicrobium funkei]|nr:hypothetical protein [Cellulosimicrobium funkei]